MTKGELGSAAIRLLGIYELVDGINKIPFLTQIVSSYGTFRGVQFYVFSVAQISFVFLPIFIGILLFLKAKHLGQLLFPHPEARLQGGLELRDAQAVAFSIVGIVLVVSGSQTFISAFSRRSFTYSQSPSAGGWLGWMDIGHVMGLARLVIGLLLFFYSTRLSNFWWNLRATRPMAEEKQPTPSPDAGTNPPD